MKKCKVCGGGPECLSDDGICRICCPHEVVTLDFGYHGEQACQCRQCGAFPDSDVLEKGYVLRRETKRAYFIATPFSLTAEQAESFLTKVELLRKTPEVAICEMVDDGEISTHDAIGLAYSHDSNPIIKKL